MLAGVDYDLLDARTGRGPVDRRQLGEIRACANDMEEFHEPWWLSRSRCTTMLHNILEFTATDQASGRPRLDERHRDRLRARVPCVSFQHDRAADHPVLPLLNYCRLQPTDICD